METHIEYNRVITEKTGTEAERKADLDPSDNLVSAFRFEQWQKRHRNRAYQATFTDAQLNFLCGDIFGAGIDTTLTTVQWILAYLCSEQGRQMALREELRSKFSGKVEATDRGQVPDLEAFILEVMRMKPVVPMGVLHGTKEGAVFGKFKLPAKTMVVPLHWHINRNPKFWKDPEVFNPERFLNASKTAVELPPFFIPFQVGNRRCVGEDFGKTMTFMIISNLLLMFDVKFSGSNPDYSLDQVYTHGFTWQPKPFKIDVFPAE